MIYASRITASARSGAQRRTLARLLLAGTLAGIWLPTSTVAEELWPLTKLRVTIVQWMPMKGTYERWDAISGEYVVAPDGTILLPVVGTIAVGDNSSEQVAAELATSLRNRLGLVEAPETTVEVIAYPPVYVMGDVTTPGAFDYLPGMTVLQAFALSGGLRPVAPGAAADRVRLSSELRLLADNLLRSQARLARMRTEVAGAQTIEFPREVVDNPDVEAARAAMAEETAILAARFRELRRQADALEDLVALLNLEIETLTSRIGDIDQGIKTAEEELAGVQTLVDKGLATASRQSDLERVVANLRFDGLTQKTAIIRARQALNEASREAARLEDERQTQLALDIQDQQNTLRQLQVQQATAQRLLFDLDVGSVGVAGAAPQPTFTIVRQGPDGPFELSGEEMTAMVPGDVLKVIGVQAVATTATNRTAAIKP